MKQYLILARSYNGNKAYAKISKPFLDKKVKEFKAKYDHVSVYEYAIDLRYNNNNK